MGRRGDPSQGNFLDFSGASHIWSLDFWAPGLEIQLYLLRFGTTGPDVLTPPYMSQWFSTHHRTSEGGSGFLGRHLKQLRGLMTTPHRSSVVGPESLDLSHRVSGLCSRSTPCLRGAADRAWARCCTSDGSLSKVDLPGAGRYSARSALSSRRVKGWGALGLRSLPRRDPVDMPSP